MIFVKSLFLNALMLTLLSKVCAQAYESAPCMCCGNETLKNLLKKEIVAEIYVHTCGIGCAHLLSSSFLKPSGKAPVNPTKSPDYKPANADDAAGKDEAYSIAFDKWSCSYAASMLSDGDVKTAWVEGVAGYGEGEIVIAPNIDLNASVEIHSGFGKSESLHKANSRPKTIQIHIVRATPKSGGASQCGTSYEKLSIVASKRAVLNDVNQFQPLVIPAFTRETYLMDGQNWDYTYWLMIEIVDVYPGMKYQDTCISEIRNR